MVAPYGNFSHSPSVTLTNHITWWSRKTPSRPTWSMTMIWYEGDWLHLFFYLRKSERGSQSRVGRKSLYWLSTGLFTWCMSVPLNFSISLKQQTINLLRFGLDPSLCWRPCWLTRSVAALWLLCGGWCLGRLECGVCEKDPCLVLWQGSLCQF